MMVRASAVEWAWLQPHLPRLELVDEERLLGGEAAAGRGTKRGLEPAAEATEQQQPSAASELRRNNDDAVAAARQRYQERQRQRAAAHH